MYSIWVYLFSSLARLHRGSLLLSAPPPQRSVHSFPAVAHRLHAHFADVLKPLGFKKKGTKWTRALDDGSVLTFDAQKSAFSDQYYFNVAVHEASNSYTIHSYERIVMYGNDIYNWQLMTQDQIENLIQYALKNHIEPKLN